MKFLTPTVLKEVYSGELVVMHQERHGHDTANALTRRTTDTQLWNPKVQLFQSIPESETIGTSGTTETFLKSNVSSNSLRIRIFS